MKEQLVSTVSELVAWVARGGPGTRVVVDYEVPDCLEGGKSHIRVSAFRRGPKTKPGKFGLDLLIAPEAVGETLDKDYMGKAVGRVLGNLDYTVGCGHSP